MRVLVSGGAGYIGTHTLLDLLADRHEVCVVDNFVNSHPEALNRVARLSNATFQVERADMTDVGRISAICAAFQPHAVIHFAGLKAVKDSILSPVEYYQANVQGTLNLLRAMDGVGCRRIVFSSSATVYGLPQYLPFDEAHPCAPVNPYGRSKLFVEEILRDWAAARDASALILRYFNPVGAHPSGQIGEDPNDVPNNLMPFIAQVAVGRRARLSVFGGDYETRDGTGERDYIHVSDLAEAHVRALSSCEGKQGAETLNIGRGAGVTVLELVRAFEAASGRSVPYDIVARRAGDVASSYADASRAKEVLGWEARRGVAEMCESVWRWQSANPDGYAG
ncbi:UDP-glucose 4-epimerase [Rubricella aquisinus]|uniref:UDP-glucose 4-epimerase n=1 Tax=Rubricella aquisinus TaxID=2028108 RepID=A0A840WWQ9_9RHOB|nr:UDP-glucose 4-epimerase [Rubricella aquisinus]